MSTENAVDSPAADDAAAVAPGAKPNAFGPSAKRLLGRMRPERGPLILVLVFAVLSVLTTVIGPKILGMGTDIIFNGAIGAGLPAGLSKAEAIAQLRAAGNDQFADMLVPMDVVPGQGILFGALGGILLVLIGIYAISFFFGWFQARILNTLVQRVIFRLRRDVEEKIHRLPLAYFDRVQRGELLSRVTNDLDNVSQTMQQTIGQIIVSLLTVIGILVMMLLISPWLTLIALVTIPLTALVVALIAKRSQKLFAAQWAQTGKLNARIEESITGHSIITLFGRQRSSQEAFESENDALFRASFGAQFVSGIIMPAMMFVGNLIYVAIAVVGGIMVAGGTMTLGNVQAFVQYSRQFSQPLSQLGSMANFLQSGIASAERVFEILDAEEESPDPIRADAGSTRTHGPGRIEFENVGFRYVADKPLIRDLSLVVEPGRTVAIVGPTGAGKTTLVNLLMRFYEVDAGRILLDGDDIALLTRHELRERTGMVLQDTWTFAGTIAENIAYGRPEATREEVRAAAQATYADRFIQSLPEGYDTVLDDDGTNLSAGEKQLLTIARAFISQPNVLILDEATSSVDTRTEQLVQRAMSALREGRTSFVIAHRLSTIRDADLILVMESGDIVEQGNHAELIAQGGAYAALYAAQFESAVDEPQAEPVLTGSIPVADSPTAG